MGQMPSRAWQELIAVNLTCYSDPCLCRDGIYYRVKGRAGAHCLRGLLEDRAVVAACVLRLALRADELAVYLRLVLGKLLRGPGEEILQLLVLRLLGKGLGPVHRQIEVAPAVVDLADLPGRRPVVVEYLSVGDIERVGEDLRPLVALRYGQVLKRYAEGKELAK